MAKKHTAPLTPFQILIHKLERLNTLREQLNATRALYVEHDALVEELLPMFITQTQTGWVINREVKIGNRTYTFVPSFYDSKKAKLTAKVWKSCAFESGRIA